MARSHQIVPVDTGVEVVVATHTCNESVHPCLQLSPSGKVLRLQHRFRSDDECRVVGEATSESELAEKRLHTWHDGWVIVVACCFDGPDCWSSRHKKSGCQREKELSDHCGSINAVLN